MNDVPILVADVELRVREALGGRAVTEDARRLLQAEALRQLIDQQKVLVQLQRRDEACTQQELDVELQRLRDDLSRQEKTLADYCQSLQVPESSLRRMVQWQLSWKRCREKNLSESNLRRYFERHARDFDGTRLRVAHILWRPDRDTPRDALIKRAQELRAQLLAGDLTFAEAARSHSQAPTADSGGELGWIDRNEPMPESFSHAAYQLEAGQISPPVESPFGIHLIKCLEIQPGQKTWQDVHEQVADAAAEYLFRWLADRPEPQHDVRFSDEVPHFLPGTRQLSR
jgi:parvulin-like peptidyl-prolyl isomerase